ncbi:Ig-like domain-containing protein [Brevibacillus borstelensis]|uniref:Ig-like domain-containing protein n=1 Tax=Brevibacillus borstelensis TaxID=45462 RepID=UPI003D817CF2
MDPDGDELTFTAESDDPSVSVTAYPTNLSARFPKQTVGSTITITVTAHDGKGGTVSSKWLIICR